MKPAAARRRSRWLPSPLTSAVLALIWPVLNGSWDTGPLLLGLLLAWAIPLAFPAPSGPRLRRPLLVLRLALVVLRDIVVSNVEVARRILGPEVAIRPRFVWVPLAITDPHGIVMLAAIVTMTPGTLSADLSHDRRHLLVHAFNADDEAALVAEIKTRYETPLMEILA